MGLPSIGRRLLSAAWRQGANLQRTVISPAHAAMKTIRVRRAREDDWESVYNINRNIYNGKDHLSCAATYRHLVTRPYNEAFLCLLEDRVLGFAMATMLNRGRTAVGRFHRIHPEFQGKGIGSMLSSALGEAILNHPSIQEIMYVKLLTGPKICPCPYGDYTIAITKPRVSYNAIDHSGVEAVSSALEKYDVNPLRWLNDDEAKYALTSPHVGRRLFPDDVILVDLMPYRRAADVHATVVDNENPYVLADDGYASLSFGTAFPLADDFRVRYKIDVYARDAAAARSHVARHARLAAAIFDNKSVAFVVCADARLRDVRADVFRAVGEAGLQESDVGRGGGQYQLIAAVDARDFAESIKRDAQSNPVTWQWEPGALRMR